MISRKIPADIRRAVRQKYGFGCIFCRCPIYQYEHIVDFSEVNLHEIENITLLCPNHHEEKRKNLISRELIQETARDFSLKERTASHLYQERHIGLVLGSNLISSYLGKAFQIGKNYFEVRISQDGTNRPLINAELFDSDGNLALKIEECEYSFSTNVWDVEFVGNLLTFREKLHEITLKVKLDKLLKITGKLRIADNIHEPLLLNDYGIHFLGTTIASGNRIASVSTCGMLISELPTNNLGVGFSGGRCIGNTVYDCDVGFFWRTDQFRKMIEEK